MRPRDQVAEPASERPECASAHVGGLRSQRGYGGCVTVGAEVVEVRGDPRPPERVTRRTSAATARPAEDDSEKCEQEHGFLDLDVDDLADGEPSGGDHHDAHDDAHDAERAAGAAGRSSRAA